MDDTDPRRAVQESMDLRDQGHTGKKGSATAAAG